MPKKRKQQKHAKTLWILSGALLGFLLISWVWASVSKPEFPMYDPNTPNRLGVVTLTVTDLPRMRTFYQEVIGLQPLKKEKNALSMTADGETPLLPDRASLGQYLLHLSSQGVLSGASNHQYSEALYLNDPEGNGIEIYADLPAEKWRTNRDETYVGGTHSLDANSLLKTAQNRSWTGLPADTKIGHMHLQVADLAASEQFYVNLLGFDVVAKDDAYLFVSKNRYHHDIGMNIWAGANIPTTTPDTKGLAYYTILFSEADWLKAKENLQTARYPFKETNGVIQLNDPSEISVRIEKKKTCKGLYFRLNDKYRIFTKTNGILPVQRQRIRPKQTAKLV